MNENTKEKLKTNFTYWLAKRRENGWAFYVAAAILICVFLLLLINQLQIQLFFCDFSKVFNAQLQVYFLDVGQASASVVIFPDKTSLVIDTGSQDSAQEMLKSVRIIFSHNKISQIDHLLLTHSDEDHIGGAITLLNNFDVKNVHRSTQLSTSAHDQTSPNSSRGYLVFDNRTLFAQTVDAIYSEPNCKVDFLDPADFGAPYANFALACGALVRLFPPLRADQTEPNYYSPYVQLTYKGRTFLFTGDAPGDGGAQNREAELLSVLQQENLKLDVDFLQVAHHGSLTSSNEEFLQAIAPKYAFISAADSSHPAQKVVSRLQNCGSKIFCTKTNGLCAVGVLSNGDFVLRDMTASIDLPFVYVCFAVLVLYFAQQVTNLQKTSKKIGKFCFNKG